jgi:hypothetical protein
LSRRDAQRVELALAEDGDLARNYELVREELNETIHLNESLGAPSARCMERLFAAIDAEGSRSPARRSFDLAGRIAEFLSGFAPRTLAWSASAAAIALVVQAAVLATVMVRDQNAQGLELASYPSGSGTLAVVRFAPQASAADITKFLEAHNAILVDGPRKSLYSIRLADTPQTDIARQVQRMQAESRVVEFIATKE